MAKQISMNMFNKNMLRTYNEQIFYNIFKEEDIKEINEVIRYGEGLVIKNNYLAERFETDTTMSNSNMYIAAIENSLLYNTTMSEIKRKTIIDSYNEGNPYYIYLRTNYGIAPYDARKTKDYHILKASNNTLNPSDEKLFIECYYDMLEYFLKVTITNAFDNQTFIREYYNTYILFGTILRYVTRKMETYFNVDLYTRRDLKNGFISWGFDYFDEVPLAYQRRIFKALNDLVRNKGTDNVFTIISNLFSYQNININKYMLAKIQDNTIINAPDSLALYKVPFDEDLDINSHEQVNYNDVVDEDPYWRSNEEEILDVRFNTVNTKYISSDINIDLSDSSKEMSYFISLLNSAEILDKDLVKDYIGIHKLTKKEAKAEYGLLDTDFYFTDNNISKSPIYIYDAIIALSLLVLNQMNYKDLITYYEDNEIKGIYGYNFNQNYLEEIKKVREHLYWNKSNFPKSKWNEYMNFFSSFRIKDISRYEQYDIEAILNEYQSNIRYYNQLLYVSEYVLEYNHSKKMNDYIKNEAIYDGIEYLINILMDNTRKVPLEVLFKYTDLHSLLSKFVDYQVETGLMSKEKLLIGFRDNVLINKELKTFMLKVNDPNLNIIIDGYLNTEEKNLEQIETFINKIMNFLYKNPDVEEYQLLFTKNLYVYLTIFTFTKDSNYDNKKISFRDLTDIFYYNEKLRQRLEDYMHDESDPMLVEKMEHLWSKTFITNYKLDNYGINKTFKSYLMEHDPNLYEYCQIQLPIYDFTTDRKPLYREKLFYLIESLDNYLGLRQDLFTRSNYTGLTEYVRRYVRILVELFKAYTLQVIDTDLSYTFKDSVDNGIRVRDTMIMADTSIFLTDEIGIDDSMVRKQYMNLDETEDSINIHDSINITVREN